MTFFPSSRYVRPARLGTLTACLPLLTTNSAWRANNYFEFATHEQAASSDPDSHILTFRPILVYFHFRLASPWASIQPLISFCPFYRLCICHSTHSLESSSRHQILNIYLYTTQYFKSPCSELSNQKTRDIILTYYITYAHNKHISSHITHHSPCLSIKMPFLEYASKCVGLVERDSACD